MAGGGIKKQNQSQALSMLPLIVDSYNDQVTKLNSRDLTFA